jgi:hypothetical protein
MTKHKIFKVFCFLARTLYMMQNATEIRVTSVLTKLDITWNLLCPANTTNIGRDRMAKVQDLLRIIKRGIILDLEMSSFSTMLRCHHAARWKHRGCSRGSLVFSWLNLTVNIIVLFVETPRKFITAKLSIRKPGSSSVLTKLLYVLLPCKHTKNLLL